MKSTRNKIEVSKKILIFCDVLLSLTVLATFIAMFLNIDISSVVQLDIALSTLTAAAHSFYYWKAKAENLHKFGKDENITMDENDPMM